MSLRLYDTATREVRDFVPLREGHVGIYHCGLTVQSAPHVGHIRKEVVFDVLAFPINPADISMCRGSYRLRPTLPATPGAECLGRVTAVGAGVTHVRPGDLVINLQRENWAQRRRV